MGVDRLETGDVSSGALNQLLMAKETQNKKGQRIVEVDQVELAGIKELLYALDRGCFQERTQFGDSLSETVIISDGTIESHHIGILIV